MVETAPFKHKGIARPGERIVYPAINVSVRVTRHANFYLYNIVFPMGLFSLMGILAPFAIPLEDGGTRIGITLTLVLTAAAYKFAISQMVPTVSYLTLIDVYVLEQAGLIALVTVQNCVVGSVSGPLARVFPFYITDEFDLFTLIAIFLLWIFLQLKMTYLWRKFELERDAHKGDPHLFLHGQHGAPPAWRPRVFACAQATSSNQTTDLRRAQNALRCTNV